jgi:high frequency lysogenization protein
MNNELENRVIALSGIFQAAHLVRQVAQFGREITPAIEASIHSLFKLESESVSDVYGGLEGAAIGLETFCAQLDAAKRGKRDTEITRYVIAILFLERKVARNTAMMDRIRAGIEAASGQAEYFSETHANVIGRLADVYQQTISTLKPRIMVTGQHTVLSHPDNANLIRALLLAGIRAAVLWRQIGGRRWQLLFQRRAMLREAQALLSVISEHNRNGKNPDVSY